jgi:hypothetical protein
MRQLTIVAIKWSVAGGIALGCAGAASAGSLLKRYAVEEQFGVPHVTVAAANEVGGQFEARVVSGPKCQAQGLSHCKEGDVLHATVLAPGRSWRVRLLRTGEEHTYAVSASGRILRTDSTSVLRGAAVTKAP